LAFGPLVVVLVSVVGGFVHVGLAGEAFLEEQREWWSRLCGALLLWSGALSGLFSLAFYGPFGVEWLRNSQWLKSGLVATWVSSTLAGVVAGRGPAGDPKALRRRLGWIINLAPLI